MNYKKYDVLGVPLSEVSLEKLVHDIRKRILHSRQTTIFSVNPEKVILSQHDPELSEALNSADILIPDGIGVILSLWLFQRQKRNRIPGIDLFESLLSIAAQDKYPVFLLGADPQVNKLAVKQMLGRYPGIIIAGSNHGYFKNEEAKCIIDKINSCNASILFVGMGSPRQEKWIHRYRHHIKATICMGVGGSFDVISGRVRRAPLCLRKMGLEWFTRLAKEPRRAERQVSLARFVFAIIKRRLLL
ncbi:MAG: WecB/TagA/CpsF family glycosyltransferase [Candidatus Aminicenantales bacterium]